MIEDLKRKKQKYRTEYDCVKMSWETNVESPRRKSEASSASVKKVSSVKAATEKYFTYATVHGYAHIWGETGYLRRLVWMVFCLLLTFYTVYQIALVISDYATYPKKITRDQAEDGRYVTFPGVTICTLSPLPRTNALKEHPMWGTFIAVENFNSTKCTENDKKDIKFQTKMIMRKAPLAATLRRKRSEIQRGEEDKDTYYSQLLDGLDDLSEPFAMSGTPDHNQEKLRLFKRQAVQNETTGAEATEGGNCSSMYQCPEGNCIPKEFLCDQYNDCANGTDEIGCGNCTEYQFTCYDGKCIPMSWKCDDIADCSQAEDEFVCSIGDEVLKCATGNRTCEDGSCLREIYICDGVQDCKEGDDETNCDSCSGRSFRCDDGQCIPSHYVCDGNQHCSGLEDEANCSVNATSCPNDHYVCGEENKCLNPRFLCNKIKDCLLGDDENATMCNSTVEASPAHQVRLKCSTVYNNTMYVNFGIFRGEEDDPGTFSCDLKDGEFTQEDNFSPMCVEGFTCDFYGCYSIKGKFYSEYTQTKGVKCALCAGKEICWAQSWINQLNQGELSIESLKLMLNKEVSDFDDLTQLFIPSKQEKENYSISTDEFIYSCKFDGYYCDPRYFQKWMSDDYGACYSFNSPLNGNNRVPYEITSAGPEHGLEVTLNVRTGMAVLSKELGVRVSIHNPEVLPMMLEEGFNVGPGTSSIRISRTKKVLLGNPHGNCSSEYNHGAPFKAYSRPICKALCLEDTIRKMCNCVKGISPIYANMTDDTEKICDPLSMEDGKRITSLLRLHGR
ncbi:uncharacterized protein [Palaemon carinicauda]|uniref:uncharacterized protein n=1 Tax=Palaemon carinicauda TaxID=392227 RepID=UPI0035B6685B